MLYAPGGFDGEAEEFAATGIDHRQVVTPFVDRVPRHETDSFVDANVCEDKVREVR